MDFQCLQQQLLAVGDVVLRTECQRKHSLRAAKRPPRDVVLSLGSRIALPRTAAAVGSGIPQHRTVAASAGIGVRSAFPAKDK